MTPPMEEPGRAFCAMAKDYVVAENPLAYTVRDTSPVTPLHTLILPKRHVASYFNLDADEKSAIDELLEQSRIDIVARDPTVMGFNIGVNIGEVAGQTIFHCHVHLIRAGGVTSPIREAGFVP